MSNLIFCLNATIPVFLLMVLGMIFYKMHIFSDAFVKSMNSFVFKIALPVLVFKELSTQDFFSMWDGRFVLFCFFATVGSITIAVLLSFIFKDSSIRGEFAQSAYRSSAALLGISFIQNIYGNAGMAPMMIIGSVPLYNIMAVILLAFLRPEREKMSRKLLTHTIIDIFKNPILIGIFIGMLWSVLQIPQPVILQKTVTHIANLATPLGLMAMGASFHAGAALSTLKPALTATFCKLVLWCAILLPLAVYLGFGDDKLVAILIMAGSPTTVSCFVMAKNMGHKGNVTSTVVMLTTILSAFTLTLWLFVIKTLGFI